MYPLKGAEGWGLRGVMSVTRNLARNGYLPKWLSAFTTVAQYCIVHFGLLREYWRGIVAIVKGIEDP